MTNEITQGDRALTKRFDVAVIGAINWDINMFVNRFARVGEEVPVKQIARVPGGKAANVAVASARILGPGKVALLGALGRDEIGKRQIEILSGEGVDTSGIKLSHTAESGQAYILIDSVGRNYINTLFGANLEISPADLSSTERLSIIRATRVVVIMDPPLATAEKMAELAREEGATVVWDAGVRATQKLEVLSKTLASTDYFVLNEVEAENLTRSRSPSDVFSALSKVNRNLKLVLKFGERGCMLASGSGVVRVPGVDLERLGMKVVNTTGAGDAFLGSFAASKAMGRSDPEALSRANAAGAVKVTLAETRLVVERERLRSLIERFSAMIRPEGPVPWDRSDSAS